MTAPAAEARGSWDLAGLWLFNEARGQVAHSPSLEPEGVTVIARVRATSVGSYRYPVAKGALECETAFYGLYTGSSGGLRFYVSDGLNSSLSNDAGTGVWDGAWHTVIGAYGDGRLRLWIDGQQVGESVDADVTIGYGLPTDDALYIGTYTGPCPAYGWGFRARSTGWRSSAATPVGAPAVWSTNRPDGRPRPGPPA